MPDRDKRWPKSKLRIASKRLASLCLQKFSTTDKISHHPDIIDGWSALITTRYDRSLLESMHSLHQCDRFFYQLKPHRHREINIWCFRNSSGLKWSDITGEVDRC